MVGAIVLAPIGALVAIPRSKVGAAETGELETGEGDTATGTPVVDPVGVVGATGAAIGAAIGASVGCLLLGLP